ncbi:MAG: hypothetical protein FWH02_06925 [Oscillospiraceae bacterium]|nr:hypothetical protein [Oscillospiraceae bacterium]
MSSRDLFRAIGAVDPALVEAADKEAPKRRAIPVKFGWIAAAACLMIIAGIVAQRISSQPEIAMPEMTSANMISGAGPEIAMDQAFDAGPNSAASAGGITDDIWPEEAAGGDSFDTAGDYIVINELPEIVGDRIIAQLLQEDFVPMDKDEITAFYGFSFFPSNLPADLAEAEDSSYGIYKEDGGTGEIYHSANIAWYVNDDVTRQLHITIDKGKLPYTDAMLLADGSDGYEKSVINGVELLIGHSSGRFGDGLMYKAEIMYLGSGMLIFSQGLDQAEFIGVIAGILG